jgi:hypothetical protein
MVEIEKYPCVDSKEACAKERERFERMGSSLNTNCPTRTDEDVARYKDNDYEATMAYHTKYRKENRDIINLNSKKKYTCECGRLLNWCYKSVHLRTKSHKQYIESESIKK